MPQCNSFLVSGQAKKCSKRAKPGQRFCHWHQYIQYTPDGDSVSKAKVKTKKEEDEAENEDKQKKKKKKNKKANKQAEPSDSEDSGQATPGSSSDDDDDPVLQLSPVVKRMLSRFKVDVKGKGKSKSDKEAEAEEDVEMLRRAIKAQKRQLENLAAAFDRLGVK